MIRAVRYESGADAATDVDASRLSEVVDAESGLVWIDVATPTRDEVEALARQLEIDPLAVEDLHEGEQRTKLVHYRNHFHVAVHDCTLTEMELVVREVDIVFGDGWLLSVRQPASGDTDKEPFDASRAVELFDRNRSEGEAVDEGLLLWAFLDVIVDGYFVIIDEFDEGLDHAEEMVFTGDGSVAISRKIFDLRRLMVEFRRSVSPASDMLAELVRNDAPCVSEAARRFLRDVEGHARRAWEYVETQRDLVAGLLESNLGVASNRMNDVMKRMTSWGAILLGATLIAGIYGMNFDEMPELRWAFGYPAAIGSMLLLTIVLYTYFKRKDYL